MIDFLLHSDRHLLEFVRAYGRWVYGLLFLIVFAETGFVVTPFLPGDSLLFAAGVLSAPVAQRAPVAKSSESPGRNGVTTNPVSAKTIANRIPYTHVP